MPDVYLNTLQLNTGNVQCIIEDYEITKSFNNAKYNRYKNSKPQLFPVSAESDKYSFTLTLYCRGDFYNELVDKEEAIYNEINTQVSDGKTINLYCDTPTWFDDDGGIELVFNSINYSRRGTDGKNFITIKFDASIVNLISELFPFISSIGIAGNAIADFSVGSG